MTPISYIKLYALARSKVDNIVGVIERPEFREGLVEGARTTVENVPVVGEAIGRVSDGSGVNLKYVALIIGGLIVYKTIRGK